VTVLLWRLQGRVEVDEMVMMMMMMMILIQAMHGIPYEPSLKRCQWNGSWWLAYRGGLVSHGLR
jgi:hypothetical protein